jgi:hypothetical protein
VEERPALLAREAAAQLGAGQDDEVVELHRPHADHVVAATRDEPRPVGNLAYVLASFDEALRPRDGQPGIRIHGRSVQFWRREEEAWRIVMLLTARSAPEESEG